MPSWARWLLVANGGLAWFGVTPQSKVKQRRPGWSATVLVTLAGFRYINEGFQSGTEAGLTDRH